MTWLLMLILLSSIASWAFTHKYQEQIIELREQHIKEIDEYNDEINRLMGQVLELQHEIQSYKKWRNK